MDDLGEALSAIRGAGFSVEDIGAPFSERVLRAALWYVGQGIPVFPVRPRDKVPLVKWRDAATVDAWQIHAWWEQWPEANIGMPTGAPLWDVIDLDGPTGFASFAELTAEGRVPEILGKAKTAGTPGRPGRHAYIAPVPGASNATNIRPHVDYRTLGGFVVVPPSMGPDGESYEWIEFPRRVGQ